MHEPLKDVTPALVKNVTLTIVGGMQLLSSRVADDIDRIVANKRGTLNNQHYSDGF